VQFESRKINIVLFVSFKLNIDAFIRSIYCNICMLFFMKLINWEHKGNFKQLHSSETTIVYPYINIYLNE